jgi:hypothetical protein
MVPDKERHDVSAAHFSILLAIFVLAAFPDVLLGLKTFVVRDFGFFSYPVAYYHRESFWRGEIPLWNPLNNCGLPFLAQWNTMVLYPLSLIYLLLPLSWSVAAFCILHLYIGGLGMYFFARGWTGSSIGAAFAGVVFAFNGLFLNFQMWLSHSAAFGLMPWVILTAEKALVTKSIRSVSIAALVGALQMLTGSPEIILFTWMFIGLVALGRCLVQKSFLPTVIIFGWVILLVAGLAAAQLLPFFELLKNSQRGEGYGGAMWSMPIWGWANFFVPLFRTYPSGQDVWFQYFQQWTSSYYFGIFALFLAALAVCRVRNRRVILLFTTFVIALILSLGDNGLLLPILRKMFPQLGFLRYPVKFLVLTLWTVPLLAAFAIAFYLSSGKRDWRALKVELGIMLVFLATIAGTVWFAHAFPMPKDSWGVTWKSGASRAVFLVIGVALFWKIREMSGRGRILVAFSILLVPFLDVLTHAPPQNPRVARAVYEPGWVPLHAKFESLPKHGETRAMVSPAAHYELHRVSIKDVESNYQLNRLAMFANCNLLDNIPKINGFYSLYPRWNANVVGLIYSDRNREHPQLLDFLGVSQTTALGSLFEWTNRASAMPMITAGQKPVFSDATNIFAALSDEASNFREVVFLPESARSSLSTSTPGPVQLLSTNLQAQSIAVELESATSNIVVIAQTYHTGWRAYVDGVEAKIWPANYGFQAVIVPEGRHQLLLRYEDVTFHRGAVISVSALVLCLIGLLRRPGVCS